MSPFSKVTEEGENSALHRFLWSCILIMSTRRLASKLWVALRHEQWCSAQRRVGEEIGTIKLIKILNNYSVPTWRSSSMINTDLLMLFRGTIAGNFEDNKKQKYIVDDKNSSNVGTVLQRFKRAGNLETTRFIASFFARCTQCRPCRVRMPSWSFLERHFAMKPCRPENRSIVFFFLLTSINILTLSVPYLQSGKWH